MPGPRGSRWTACSALRPCALLYAEAVRNLELNGHVPDLAETHRLTTRNYGHFTSMQVRDGGVRGLALHFARLADGNEDFFSYTMDVADEHRLRELIRHALRREPDASVRVGFVPPGSDEGP